MAINQRQVGPVKGSNGTPVNDRGDRDGSAVVTEAHGRYTEGARNGNIFYATAIVTAPVIFSTAAGTGGPLIWNGTANKTVNILKVGYAITTASTVAGALGLTGNTGQVAAPTSTTAIDSRTNGYLGGAASGSTPYRIGTPTAAGNFFIPLAQIHTGAITVDTTGVSWIDVEGGLVVPPNGWVSIAASATLTTAVMQITVMYEELDF